MNIENVKTMLAYWSDPDHKPIKRQLADGCGGMCAQGQVLHTLLSYSPEDLLYAEQDTVDRLVAKTLGISVSLAIALRVYNDLAYTETPSRLFENPADLFGPHFKQMFAFWEHLDTLTEQQIVGIGRMPAHYTELSHSLPLFAVVYTPPGYRLIQDKVARAVYEIAFQSEITSFPFLNAFGFKTPADIPIKD